MDDKKSTKSSDDKKNAEPKSDEQNTQKGKREIPDVEKSDRITLPEMRIDFDAGQTLVDE